MVEIFAISGVHPSDLFPRGSRIRRVVRPGMLGIASFNHIFNPGVAGFPKTGQKVYPDLSLTRLFKKFNFFGSY